MDDVRIRNARNASGPDPSDEKPQSEPERPRETEQKDEPKEVETRTRSRMTDSGRRNMKIKRGGPKLDIDNTKLKLIGAVTGAVLVVIVLGMWLMSIFANNDNNVGVDANKYQAVLLTNGEAYLGKLTVLNAQYLKLEDVFYLKPQAETESDDESQNSTADQSVQLIKFGKDEVQGPEDEIIIARDQVLYFQNLKPKGKASVAIEEYKKSN